MTPENVHRVARRTTLHRPAHELVLVLGHEPFREGGVVGELW